MQKSLVQQILDEFGNEVNLDSFLEQVYLREKLNAGEQQIIAGETTSHEDAKQRLKKWLA